MIKFIRATILGGVVFLLPFAVLSVLIAKLIATTKPVVETVSGKLPLNAVAGVSVSILLSVLLLVVVSFLAGFFARTRSAKSLVKELEKRVLSRVPAYGLLKSVSEDIVSGDDQGKHPVVLVHFDDSRQLGIKTGVSEDGRLTVVFVPDSPTPQTGTVLVMDTARIEETDIPLTKAFAILSGRGLGLEEHLPGPQAR